MHNRMVLVRCPHSLAGPFGSLVASIVDTLERHDRVVMFSTRAATAQDRYGAILVRPPGPLPKLRHPFVVVGSRPPPPAVAAVWSDPRAGSGGLLAHLRALGHRRIATMGDGRDDAHELLASPRPPTALVCGTAALATDALRAAAARGLRVPQDVSVAALDDSGAAARPDLTVVRPPWPELGRLAATTLVALLEGVAAAPRIEVPAELVLRGSIGPAA